MKYLLLDIDGTIVPSLNSEEDEFSNESLIFGIPYYIGEWLIDIDEYPIIWCTNRSADACQLIEEELGFDTKAKLDFSITKDYRWNKTNAIINFCQKHPSDSIILADDDALNNMDDVEKLPDNLIIVTPSDTKQGCLSREDLLKIDAL